MLNSVFTFWDAKFSNSFIVVTVAEELYKMGCYEISLGDTIGVGTPGKTFQLIKAVKTRIPVEKIAGIFTFIWNLNNVFDFF